MANERDRRDLIDMAELNRIRARIGLSPLGREEALTQGAWTGVVLPNEVESGDSFDSDQEPGSFLGNPEPLSPDQGEAIDPTGESA